MKRHEDFLQVTEGSLDKSMKAFKIDPSMKNELLNLYKVLSPFKEVPEALKTLKAKKFKLAILSNGTPSLLNELVRSNDLNDLFDDLFSVEEVGIYKPDAKVYDLPIKKYEIERSMMKTLSAMLFKSHKIIPAVLKGYIPLKIKGHFDIAVTDVLINEQGTVDEVYYAKKDIADHFSFEKIKEFATS